MRSKEHIRLVEKALKDALKNDRAHIVMGRISKFGILELSRERLSPPLLEKSHISCPFCGGAGLVRSVESSGFRALREIQLFLNRNKVSQVRVSLPRDVGLYLLNQQKRHLLRIEQEFSATVTVTLSDTLGEGQSVIEPVKSS